MSDTMLHGVLRMPPDLWRDDPIDVAQRHSRYVEASDRIIEQEAEIAQLRRVVDNMANRPPEPKLLALSEQYGQALQQIEAQDAELARLRARVAELEAAEEVAACCGRRECGGECGNEWQGMRPAAPPAARQDEGRDLRPDARRLLHVFREIDGYNGVDIHEQASINASFAGRDEPSDADYLAAIRSTVDAAMSGGKGAG